MEGLIRGKRKVEREYAFKGEMARNDKSRGVGSGEEVLKVGGVLKIIG